MIQIIQFINNKLHTILFVIFQKFSKFNAQPIIKSQINVSLIYKLIFRSASLFINEKQILLSIGYFSIIFILIIIGIYVCITEFLRSKIIFRKTKLRIFLYKYYICLYKQQQRNENKNG